MGLMTGARQRDTGAPNGPDRDCDITTNLCNTQTNDPVFKTQKLAVKKNRKKWA